MGWAMLLLAATLAAAALWRFGLPPALWRFAGAALMLGATGYALQGSPGLPGASARSASRAQPVEPEIVDLRGRMIGRFTGEAAYFTASDAMLRVGDAQAAVAVMQGAVRGAPGSAFLWMGLGSAYARHDASPAAAGGQGSAMSPAARFAFGRALQLNPLHPAPPFFLGLALIEAGDLPGARPWWARALALTPSDASYRRDIALRLALLDRFLSEARTGGTGQRPSPPPAPPRDQSRDAVVAPPR